MLLRARIRGSFSDGPSHLDLDPGAPQTMPEPDFSKRPTRLQHPTARQDLKVLGPPPASAPLPTITQPEPDAVEDSSRLTASTLLRVLSAHPPHQPDDFPERSQARTADVGASDLNNDTSSLSYRYGHDACNGSSMSSSNIRFSEHCQSYASLNGSRPAPEPALPSSLGRPKDSDSESADIAIPGFEVCEPRTRSGRRAASLPIGSEIEDSSDAAYEHRHRKPEWIERRTKNREKELLQHHLYRQKLELERQRSSLINSQFHNSGTQSGAAHSHAPSLVHEVPTTLSDALVEPEQPSGGTDSKHPSHRHWETYCSEIRQRVQTIIESKHLVGYYIGNGGHLPRRSSRAASISTSTPGQASSPATTSGQANPSGALAVPRSNKKGLRDRSRGGSRPETLASKRAKSSDGQAGRRSCASGSSGGPSSTADKTSAPLRRSKRIKFILHWHMPLPQRQDFDDIMRAFVNANPSEASCDKPLLLPPPVGAP
ncbi:uncharacterized protein BJ171DRAFT_509654 [Polychytrium aggregatum]|uniref:uncharacterized protein n=1 Tax=Polychytrium aggregatum TaxID=110093 RepID=UPI0022FEC1F6|nr:uncharacterized protein BJ171DRAFT_509654 [Polychytrium aggregatum]KAI9203434.1 hypothetical protein BJ171DRAFT_509654 [Polychytrium aggregatum]